MTARATPRSAAVPAKATRRPRGAPRQLLLRAARDLFSRQDYRSTTTKDIAEEAGVVEHLIFRQFGSKAALFREALVVPFTAFIDEFATTWQDLDHAHTDEEVLAGRFVGELYDLFVEHRGLIMTMWSADAMSEEDQLDAGIAEIDRGLGVLAGIGAEGMAIRGGDSGYGLAAHSTVAMVAGMAAFPSRAFGGIRPPRDVVVAELTQVILHGLLHRPR